VASAGMTGIRDKVVAACLTGAVVVVVGYASGIGLQPMASTAPQALPPAAPAAPHGDHAHAEPHADGHGHSGISHSDSHADSHGDSHGMSHAVVGAGHGVGASHLASASHTGGHETGGHHDTGGHAQPHDDHTGAHPPDDDHEDHGGQHPPPDGPPEDDPGPGCEEDLLGGLLDDLLGPLTGLTGSCDRRDETRTGS